MSIDDLTGHAARLAAAELELESKGFSPDQARMASRRAVRWAGRIAGKVPASVRPQCFEALLQEQLEGSEAWLEGMAAAAREGRVAKGYARALRDDVYRDQVERKLEVDARPAADRFREAAPGATAAWEAKALGDSA